MLSPRANADAGPPPDAEEGGDAAEIAPQPAATSAAPATTQSPIPMRPPAASPAPAPAPPPAPPPAAARASRKRPQEDQPPQDGAGGDTADAAPQPKRRSRGGKEAVAAEAPKEATAAAPAPTAVASSSNTSGKRRDSLTSSKPVSIAFSGFNDHGESFKHLITSTLKGHVEDDTVKLAAGECTHIVVATPVKRTIKLLVGVSMQCKGLVIVTKDWLLQCEQAGAFVPPTPYLLAGEHSSQPNAPGPQWTFDAGTSRSRAADGGGNGCLHGLSFYVTKETKPKPNELKLIIEAAGGQVLEKAPKGSEGGGSNGSKVIVVSTPEEKKVWSPLLSKQKQLVAVKPEGVLSAVLQQKWKVDGKAHLLA